MEEARDKNQEACGMTDDRFGGMRQEAKDKREVVEDGKVNVVTEK